MTFRATWASALLLVLGCSDGTSSQSEDLKQSKPAKNWSRDVVSTELDVDLEGNRATARIEVGASKRTGVSFEVGDLSIESVRDEKGPLPFKQDGSRLDVGYAAKRSGTIEIAYGFRDHTELQGATSKGLTFTWPSFCGNLFPCKSDPSDGLRFELSLSGVPSGAKAIFPPAIEADAPAYMLAWAVGDYTEIDLGKTASGTSVRAWYLPGEKQATTKGTAHLRDVVEWYEQTYGDYLFGDVVGSVSAEWGGGAFGGMEHHPFWHVSRGSMGDEETHAHEAAHGWFGDGVRIECWEDLTLSEGTTSYVTARALEATAGKAAGDGVWASYEQRLDSVVALQDRVARPEGCNQVDVLNDLWNDVVYMKGAFFYRAVEAEIGREALDRILAGFYAAHREKAAGVDDMLDAIREESGFDPEPLADVWLRSLGRPE